MIPIRLSLRNFMCYRDNVPPLDLSGIHTACISGDNGSGKSALIDAMTWALWGKARTRSADDLIYQGQNDMAVVFDFAVGKEVYRVIRKHSRPSRLGRSGQTSLDFFIALDGGMRPIAGDSIRQTEQKIIDTLHMDYETFINSALLLQGRADEFTKQQPSQRAKVLSEILGFSFYDELAEEARGRANAAEMEKTQLESTIKDITEELLGKADCEANLMRVVKELSSLEKVIEEQEERLKELRLKKESLENKEKELALLEEHMKEKERLVRHLESEMSQHYSRLKEYEELIARSSEIEKCYAELVEVKRLEGELSQTFRNLASLRESKHRLEMRIFELGQNLNQEHALIASKIRELEAEVEKLPEVRQERQLLESRTSELAELEKTVLARKEAQERLSARLHELESGKAYLGQDIKEVEEKLAMLAHDGGHCPLCETELGHDGIELVRTKYTSEKETKFLLLKATQGELVSRKTELEATEKDVSRLEMRLNKDRAEVQGKVSLNEQKIREVEEAKVRLEGAKKTLSEIEERLARRDFAQSEQLALIEIEKGIAGLDYDGLRHEEVQKRLAVLEPYGELKRRLEEAEQFLVEEKEALARAEEAHRDLQSSLKADTKKKEEVTFELVGLPELRDEISLAEKEKEKLTLEQKNKQEEMGRLKGRFQHYGELEKRKVEKKELLKKALAEEEIYQVLADAFGKKGVQAIFIETALPEIEIEANHLLSRMTDNRMHLTIETQKQSKRGDVLETLDINISDELGTRNYEMFSGGEAFRINFAIRIALAGLLARRAGAPLPTLVIDEGFGTQDGTGIEKIKEAISSIQDDFEKILVITHLEELKDAFPNRINVVKESYGSTIEVG